MTRQYQGTEIDVRNQPEMNTRYVDQRSFIGCGFATVRILKVSLRGAEGVQEMVSAVEPGGDVLSRSPV